MSQAGQHRGEPPHHHVGPTENRRTAPGPITGDGWSHAGGETLLQGGPCSWRTTYSAVVHPPGSPASGSPLGLRRYYGEPVGGHLAHTIPEIQPFPHDRLVNAQSICAAGAQAPHTGVAATAPVMRRSRPPSYFSMLPTTSTSTGAGSCCRTAAREPRRASAGRRATQGHFPRGLYRQHAPCGLGTVCTCSTPGAERDRVPEVPTYGRTMPLEGAVPQLACHRREQTAQRSPGPAFIKQIKRTDRGFTNFINGSGLLLLGTR